jgi:hypothetical protein
MGSADRGDGRARVAPEGTERRRAAWLARALIAIAAAIAYAPSFAVPFQFDDQARLLHNVAMQQGVVWDALLWLGNSRVVPSLTFLANYWLGGYAPAGYHVVNFAVHLLTTLGVFALARALCRTPRLRDAWPPRRALLLATAAAFVFACHPLQTQAVTYIIQRYASMAALFYVWAVVCFLRARLRRRGLERGAPGPYLAATLGLAVCAVLSKEHAVSLPGALLLAEVVGFGWPRRSRRLVIGAVAVVSILAVPAVWKALTWAPPPSQRGLELPVWRRAIESIFEPRFSPLGAARPTPVTYLYTQATVLPRYLRLTVLPIGLTVDHDAPFMPTASAAVLAGFTGLAALAAFGIWQLPRRPLLGFAIIWFFVTVSVESSVLPIDDAMMEHRMYLPMAGLAVGAGWLFAAAVQRVGRVAWGAGAVVAGALAALTLARNLVWLSPVTLWLDAAEKSPNKARAHANLGAEYHKVGRLTDAVAQYCRALELAPNDQISTDNLDLALTRLGVYDDVVPEVVERRPNGSVVLALPAPVTFCPRGR